MTILFTVASFSNYMLGFMNKYYEGSIFVNYYLDALAGALGAVLGLVSFKFLRIKWSFIVGLTLTLLGGFFLLMFQ